MGHIDYLIKWAESPCLYSPHKHMLEEGQIIWEGNIERLKGPHKLVKWAESHNHNPFVYNPLITIC